MKKLSFILALVIALTGMIGLFATPAYAADATTLEVGEGKTYATIGAALAATGETGSYVIEVYNNTNETVIDHVLGEGKSVTIRSAGETSYAVNITPADDTSDSKNTVDSQKYHGWFIMTGGTVVIDNLDVTVNQNGSSAGNYCLVYFVNTAAGYGNVVIDKANIVTYGRCILVGATAGVHAGTTVNISISNSTMTSTASKIFVQFNNRKAGAIANINLTNVGFADGVANALLSNAETLTFNAVNCYSLPGTKLAYGFNSSGTKYGTINFINCEYNIGNYLAANSTGSGNVSEINVYSGTYNTSDKGIQNNSATAKVNIYGGTFTSTSANGFIMGASTKAYFYGGTIDAALPFNTNNAGQQATGIQAITDGTKTTYVPEGITVDTTLLSAKGAQIVNGTTSESASTSIRLVFQIKATEAELANYSAIGVWASKSNSTVMDLGDLNAQAKVTVLPTTTTVYTSVNADGVVVEAAEGYYYILVEISNISNANFADVIYVRPYVVAADGTTVTAGDAYVTSVNSFLK